MKRPTEATIAREAKKRAGVNERAFRRLNNEHRDPWTGERVVVVNGVVTYPDDVEADL